MLCVNLEKTYHYFKEAFMKHFTISLVACMLLIPLAAFSISAQETADPADLIGQFFPEGTTVLTATKAELAEAVKKAITANPTKVSKIVSSTAAARPDAVEEIVMAAAGVAPEELTAICYAAREGAPERALDVHACQDIFGASVRLEGLPVTKPSREEPSPVKPR